MNNKLIGVGIMNQPFVVASALFGQVVKTDWAWHNQEDTSISTSSMVTKEMILKDQERDENIAKMMMHWIILQNMLWNLLQGSHKNVNATFEAL